MHLKLQESIKKLRESIFKLDNRSKINFLNRFFRSILKKSILEVFKSILYAFLSILDVFKSILDVSIEHLVIRISDIRFANQKQIGRPICVLRKSVKITKIIY